MSRDKKDIKEAINQLEKLKYHSEGAEDYEKNKKALMMAIEVLKEELQYTKVINVQGIYRDQYYYHTENEILKTKYKMFLLNCAVEKLKHELITKDLITYKYKNNGTDFEVIAELEILKREGYYGNREFKKGCR